MVRGGVNRMSSQPEMEEGGHNKALMPITFPSLEFVAKKPGFWWGLFCFWDLGVFGYQVSNDLASAYRDLC